ncbi:MAG TPA: N-acetylmuramoyl-L-alanine amidase, partial [Anaeromyxobacteraceae bacterium]|nr:N-acetylmuramoyl-L-alanine amidase [Anaeromyxobacteraceae bacterium]
DGLDPVLQRALAAAAARGDPEAPSAAGPAPEGGPDERAEVGSVRTWANADYTRVAIALSRPVRFTEEELPPSGGAPRRFALELSPARLARPLDLPVRDALVRRVRADGRGDAVRLVLDLAGQGEVSAFALDDPPRLIVDVGVSQARREAQARGVRGGDGEAGPGRPIRRIVVDAGHGGHDAGAIGPSRVREKDVTLAMARRLARRLEERGFEVVLTRDSDRYVALEERTAIANARRGDLFVSLHANAHPRRDRRGLETYVLDVADGRYARRLAARENGAWREEGDAGLDVRRILTDLDARASAEASRRLAGQVQAELVSGLRARVGEVRDLGVKSAVFYVLLGARMPAILVETAFISNRAEERRLASPRYQEEVAGSVARAVEAFARREARVASAARPAVD